MISINLKAKYDIKYFQPMVVQLCADISEDIVIVPHETKEIPTGIFMSISNVPPDTYVSMNLSTHPDIMQKGLWILPQFENIREVKGELIFQIKNLSSWETKKISKGQPIALLGFICNLGYTFTNVSELPESNISPMPESVANNTLQYAQEIETLKASIEEIKEILNSTNVVKQTEIALPKPELDTAPKQEPERNVEAPLIQTPPKPTYASKTPPKTPSPVVLKEGMELGERFEVLRRWVLRSDSIKYKLDIITKGSSASPINYVNLTGREIDTYNTVMANPQRFYLTYKNEVDPKMTPEDRKKFAAKLPEDLNLGIQLPHCTKIYLYPSPKDIKSIDEITHIHIFSKFGTESKITAQVQTKV